MRSWMGDRRPGMRCLRIYATPDGEFHLGEVDIAMTMTPRFLTKRRLNFRLTTQRHASVLLIFPPGCAKRAFTGRRIDSSPYGSMATWNLNERWRCHRFTSPS